MKGQINKLIKEFEALQPIADEAKKKLNEKFRLEFNFNSNHLEGSTLTYGETKLLLLFDQTKGNHELREYEEMKAHDVALHLIAEEAAESEKPLTEKFIKDLNETILVRTFWKDAITNDGQQTRRKIKVGSYKEYPNSVLQANGEVFEYASPSETPRMMAELVQWFNEEHEKKELTAVELAALLHYRYIRIHPFDDGNGRVARLLVNYVLYKDGLPPIIIKTEDKKNYLRALQQADADDLQAFIDYVILQLAWSLDITIKAAKGESIEEQDDWEKKLSLLKKGLGDKDGQVVKKSDHILKSAFETSIIPFIKLYENKLIQFDSLFLHRHSSICYNEKKIQIYTSLTEPLSNIVIHKDLNYMYINNSFANYRNSMKFIDFIDTLEVKIHLGDNAYQIEYKDKIISKLYSDILSEEEMKVIISDIGKDLMQKIEDATKE